MRHIFCGRAAWIGLLASLATSGALAQAALEPAFTWRGPPECPQRDDVLRRVLERLPAGEPTVVPWEAAARVVRRSTGYRLELELRTGEAPVAHRRLDAATCGALADAAAVLIALALEPPLSEPADAVGPPAADSGSATREPRDPTPSAAEARPRPTSTGARPAAPSSTTASSPSEPDDAATEVESTPLPIDFTLAARARFDVGTLPGGPGFGLQPQAGVQLGDVRATAGLTLWLSSERRPQVLPTARVQGHAWFADLALGYALADPPLRIVPMLVVEHGRLTLGVLDIAAPAERTVAWTAAGGAIEATYALGGGFTLIGELAGLAPFSRPRSLVQTATGDVPVHTVSAFLLRISLGARYVLEVSHR